MAFVSWEEKSIDVPGMLFHVNMSWFCITTLMSHKVAQELAASETPWNQNQITQKDVEARFRIKAFPPAFPPVQGPLRPCDGCFMGPSLYIRLCTTKIVRQERKKDDVR